MTTVLSYSDYTKRPLRLLTPTNRWLAWAFSKLITIFAVFSAATWGWHHWIDLRFAGPVIQYGLPILWTVTLLLLNFLAQPRILAGSTPHWLHTHLNTKTLNALLIPTYLILACLLANLGVYIHLSKLDRIDAAFHIPICVPVMLLIVFWLWTMYRWQQVVPHQPQPLRKSEKYLSATWLIVCFISAGWFFYLQGVENPPPAPVDVAVVFGHRVMSDGSASDTLRARTLAGVDLYRRHLARHIMVSGQIDKFDDGHFESEALAMRDVCRAEGVPDQDIFIDPIGVNTRASAYNAKILMQQQNWHTVVGVSSDYHLFRIAHSFAEVGIPAYTVASQPTVWVPAEPFDLVRETTGILVYYFNPNYRQAKGEQMNVRQPRIVVHKSGHQLQLFDAGIPVKTYNCFTGTNAGDKEREGDRKTPEGTFHIVYKNPESKFHLSLGLDYPNHEDAQRGLATGLLTQQQYDTLINAIDHGDMTTEATQKIVWNTKLGGEIFIHGGAENRDTLKGSAGCVVITNADIEELYAVCEVGTPVTIEP